MRSRSGVLCTLAIQSCGRSRWPSTSAWTTSGRVIAISRSHASIARAVRTSLTPVRFRITPNLGSVTYVYSPGRESAPFFRRYGIRQLALRRDGVTFRRSIHWSRSRPW